MQEMMRVLKYPGRELNPYFRCGKLDFKSSASTSSATQVTVPDENEWDKNFQCVNPVSVSPQIFTGCTKKIQTLGLDYGAEDRARTGHPDLGKVVLYQMSYFRVIY